MKLSVIIALVILALSILAVSRILVGLIVANCHQLNSLDRQAPLNNHRFSVVIPAFNEEKLIVRTIVSVLRQNYSNFEVIAVDDGSTDKTGAILDRLAQKYPKLQVVHQANQGKSTAINTAVRNWATGDLVMVLDADSYLNKDALTKMARRFDDPNVIGMSANVRITQPHNFLEWVQKVEYLLGYRLKGAEEILGIEYIIGGIGSTFRRKAMQEQNYTYPTDYGVATYEEFDWMLTMRPEISRIKQDSREIGKRAASLLHQKIEHPDQVPKQPDTIVIPTSLIIKNSF